MPRGKTTKTSESAAKKGRQKRLGAFLAELRESKNLSLQRVSKETGISDPFLYQLERGERALTNPVFFNKIASFYEIKVEELLKRAGYIPEESIDEILDQAVQKIIRDKSYNLKAPLFAKLTFKEKIDLITLYEKATRKKLLDRGLELFQ